MEVMQQTATAPAVREDPVSLRQIAPTLLSWAGDAVSGSLEAVEDYVVPIRATDPATGCRTYSVILVTDGAESGCGGPNGAGGATALISLPIPVRTYLWNVVSDRPCERVHRVRHPVATGLDGIPGPATAGRPPARAGRAAHHPPAAARNPAPPTAWRRHGPATDPVPAPPGAG